jgi:hypothetical protein
MAAFRNLGLAFAIPPPYLTSPTLRGNPNSLDGNPNSLDGNINSLDGTAHGRSVTRGHAHMITEFIEYSLFSTTPEYCVPRCHVHRCRLEFVPTQEMACRPPPSPLQESLLR